MLESFIGELIKIARADVTTTLLPHQERVKERIKKQKGLVVAHGLGSGKTLSSIAALADIDPKKSKVLVPASLKANYLKEVEKHTTGKFTSEVESLQRSVLRDNIGEQDILVIDEAHRIRDPKSKTYRVIKKSPADKKVLLTASPVYNRPNDIAPLVNLAAGEKVLPEGVDFDKRYIVKPNTSGILALLDAVLPGDRVKNPKITRKDELREILREWVDYHESTGGDFPQRIDTRIKIPMTDTQTGLHDWAWGKLPLVQRMKLKAGLPPNKKDLSQINAFQSQARQVANTISSHSEAVEESPKIKRAAAELLARMNDNKDHKTVVYSNYLQTLDDYGKVLDDIKIPYGVFRGGQSMSERKQIIDDYNNDIIKTLLVSSAGGEGLDLKGTRMVQVLEPHWNDEKLKQVTGRAIRHGSHSHLNPSERNVEVQSYEAYPKPGIARRIGSFLGIADEAPTGVEQILYRMSESKEMLNNELKSLLF